MATTDPTPNTDPLSVLYATDEHLAIRAGGDFVALTPAWQVAAAGSDGAFASGSPWDLTSASIDFEAAGIGPGSVCLLTRPQTTFRGSGVLLAVDQVDGPTATLRPIGPGSGSSPVPAAGLSGVVFAFPTLRPQIEDASFDLNRRYGIDPASLYRNPSNLVDLRELRAACVVTVLLNRYTFEARGKDGDYRAKARLLRDDLDQMLARLGLRWTPAVAAPRRTTPFNTRISR
ncbi:hypothetical protein [Paludisphaera rhizosphaerae]|uniref:hypothetical protein n=1 Tax=Paludisphaera rhizosphaerae TaxID=2711216 RepID=UPI0013EDAF0E|nr:hypothetical protein [Paludisphaera rhizosphaerae]